MTWSQASRRATSGLRWMKGRPRRCASTSGTTGLPKGVVYSHRALALHAMVHAHADTTGMRESDVVLHLVPMFHALAWCYPYAAAMVGAAQVLPGPHPSPDGIADLMQSHRVTLSAAVPTVWRDLLCALERAPRDLSSIRLLVSGGAAAARRSSINTSGAASRCSTPGE